MDASAPRPEPALADSLGLHRYTWTRGKLAVLASGAMLILVGGLLGLTEPAPQTAASPSADQASAQPAQSPSQGTTGGAGLPPLPGDTLAPGADALTPTGGFSETRRLPFTGAPTTGDGVEVPPPTPLPSAAPAPADATASEPILWSGPMLRGGFGLVVGFLIGFAIRAFLRLAGVIVGFYLLSLTVLSYAGWITIHWDVIEAQVVPALGSLGNELQSFKTFLQGSLPTAGLASVGLATGLRQK